VLVPMLSALILVVVVVRLISYWSQASDWGDLHLLALASGAQVAHTLIGILDPETKDRLSAAVLELIMIVLLVLLAMRIRSREDSIPLADLQTRSLKEN
jgi:hypothetical protein